MAAKPGVRVVITGDTKGLERALDRSSGALSGFGRTAAGVFGGLALAKGVELAADGLRALGSFALEGIDKLDALGDATARLDSMVAGLGDTATAVDLSRWGVDQGEAAASALAIAKMGKALGLTDDELRTMTPELQKMSAQLASLGDGDPAAQAELLAKALGGNAKAAKALGVALPKGAKGLEAYAALTAQLGPQLDQATSGTVSLADVGERWDATLANLQLELAGFLDQLAPVIAQLMDALLPVLRELVDTVGPAVSALFAGLSEALTGFLEGGSASGVAAVFGSIAGILGELAGFVAERVVPVLLELASAVADALAPVLPVIADAFAAWMPVLDQVWGFVEDVIVPVLRDLVLPFLGKLLEITARIVAALGGALSRALRTLSDAFAKLLEWAQPVIDALGAIARFGGDALGAIGNVLPFRSSPGSPALAVAGARGGSVVVNVSTGVGDPVAIGRAVSRYLGAYTVRGGSL